MPDLLFHGAAGEVTGSMHMVEVDGHWVALDCGLFYGRRQEAEEKNRCWPVSPLKIAAVVLSHAHIDHCGRLPRLVKDGFDGPIYCTPATRDLAAIMLPDSAHIQEEDVRYVSKKRRRQGLPPIEPLYTYEDVMATIKLFQTISYKRWFQVIPGLLACFEEAGHMLGSSGVRLEFAKRNGATPSLFYTGDVGRWEQPILRNPADFPPNETIICESTYGGRINETVDDAKEQLLNVVRHTIDRGGKVIIPAFSVGRTQVIVYYLHELMLAGLLPQIAIFVDSPLAVNATEVFKMHPECYDADARALYQVAGDILGGGYCTYVRTLAQSMALNERTEPCVIISASGMCEAGRIRHHLKHNITNPKNTILLAGYQAANTLGRKLEQGAERIRLFQEEYAVRAEVRQIHGFSGHADQTELLRLLTPRASETRALYLVHGEPDQAQELADRLRAVGFRKVVVAERDRRYSL